MAALWPPFWFFGVLDLPTDGAVLLTGLCLTGSASGAFIRLTGNPRVAWATLAYWIVVTVIVSLAMNLGDVPDHPWLVHYPAFVVPIAALHVLTAMLWVFLLRRRGHAARAPGDFGSTRWTGNSPPPDLAQRNTGDGDVRQRTDTPTGKFGGTGRPVGAVESVAADRSNPESVWANRQGKGKPSRSGRYTRGETVAESSSRGVVQLRFSGSVREYFGIWIVNLLLSIATLGIYSAWAKVRNKKYFLGNTTIDGRPFDYHATGRQILIGRAIVVVMFALLWILPSIDPAFGGAWAGITLISIPILINRGLRFNASVTSWSNVRFRFEGSDRRAMLIFGLYLFLSTFTLYLTFPYVARAVKRFTIGGHSLGQHRFSFDSGIGPFYRAFLLSAAWVMAVLVLCFLVVLLGRLADDIRHAQTTGGYANEVVTLAFSGLILLAVFPLATVYGAFVRNAIYAGTTLEGGHRFQSTISPMRLIWIAISNAVAVVASLGMLLPWAHIRVARYLCANTWVRPAGTLNQFVGEAERRQSAIGEAYMDIDGADVGGAV